MIAIYENTFSNIGFTSAKFSNDQLLPIKQEIDKIQKNWDVAVKANNILAGHIKKEYILLESHLHIENLITPLVNQFDASYDYFKQLNFLSSNKPLYLDKCWVNFQTKNEFNPIHNHDGIMSFVIWVKIPYNREDENKIYPDQTIIKNGCFEFVYTNSLGDVAQHGIVLDKTYENVACVFPASMKHIVYPFYSSDEYRISISGNFKLKV
jgi:hypothetical protein